MNLLKFRTRIGQLEVDFEGTEEFLKAEVPSLVSQIIALSEALPVHVTDGKPSATTGGAPVSRKFDFTTNTIASLAEAKTGPDLAMAAAAHLALTKGQDKFARKEILEEMQSATTFYNQGYSGNLTKILNGLTKGKRLNLVGNQTYALTKAERDAWVTKLQAEG